MAGYDVKDIEKIVAAVAAEIMKQKSSGISAGGINDCNGQPKKSCAASGLSGQDAPIPVEVSARHIHLTVEAVEKLFGKGYRLTKKKDLSQPGEFLSGERIKIVTQKGELANVAVLGPERPKIQVELSKTDCRTLGIDVPVCISGDLEGGGDMLIVGPKGIVEANECTIVAQAHVHMTPADARKYNVRDGQELSISLLSKRPITLDSCIARVSERASLAVHIDFDEANASLTDSSTKAVIVRRGGDNLTAMRQGYGLPSGADPDAIPYDYLKGMTRACVESADGGGGNGGAIPSGEAGLTSQRSAPCPVMKNIMDKRLITEADAKVMAESAKGEIRIPKGILITPLAKDVFTGNKIKMILE